MISSERSLPGERNHHSNERDQEGGQQHIAQPARGTLTSRRKHGPAPRVCADEPD
jgi:hypothetical protein